MVEESSDEGQQEPEEEEEDLAVEKLPDNNDNDIPLSIKAKRR